MRCLRTKYSGSFLALAEVQWQMWALLSDPGHSDSFKKHGAAYVPLCRLVEQLADREYADQVYAFTSLSSFNLTTAPSYEQADDFDAIGVEYNPKRKLFNVTYHRVSASRDLGRRVMGNCCCGAAEIDETIDSYIQVLLNRRAGCSEPHSSPVHLERNNDSRVA